MTTSGSVDFSMTRNEIITDSLSIIRVLGEDESPTSSAMTQANRFLNRLIKGFENQSKHVWKKREATLFLQAGQSKYDLHGSSSDHCTDTYFTDTLTTALVTSDTVIHVTDTTDVSNDDHIGIILDSGSLFWSTVLSHTSTTITLNDAITGSATSGNTVYTYTNDINKPLSILDIRRQEVSSGIESYFPELSYEEYMRLPNKNTNASTVVQWMYARKSSNGFLFMYPSPSDTSFICNLTYSPPFEDFDNSGDTPDFPQEWYDVLVLGLALRLAHPYGKNQGQDFDRLKMDYEIAKAEALAFDVEATYLTLSPKRSY